MGVHLCLRNIHLVPNGGESLKQPREPFLRVSVVTTQEESSYVAILCRINRRGNGAEHQGQRISQEEGTRSEVSFFK